MILLDEEEEEEENDDVATAARRVSHFRQSINKYRKLVRINFEIDEFSDRLKTMSIVDEINN